MSMMRGLRGLWSTKSTKAGLALILGALAGCQTYYGGMTVPSGHYLDHPPQFAPESPAYPFIRELATLQAQAAQAEAGVPPGLPARVPVGGP
jgi:hypothetical protein